METANSTVIVSTPVPVPAPTPVPSAAIAQSKSLQGSVLVLIQFDVCEEINLDALRDIFGARRQEASFKHPAPGYVRFERAPVVEPVEPLILESGERLDVQIKYYDYGVLSVVFELPFSGDPATAGVTEQEVLYLCDAVGRWFAAPLRASRSAAAARSTRPRRCKGGCVTFTPRRNTPLRTNDTTSARESCFWAHSPTRKLATRTHARSPSLQSHRPKHLLLSAPRSATEA